MSETYFIAIGREFNGTGLRKLIRWRILSSGSMA